jgi:DegV family protein with EDD domain
VPGPRRVRVVTDSTCDIPPFLLARWGVEVVPLYIQLGEETYRDGVDLTPEDFYARLRRGEFPRTAQPAIGSLRRVYEQLGAGGGEMISIHLSAGLSGTYQSALLAAEQVDARIAVLDSGLLSMGLGWLVLAAAEAAREGQPLDEIVALVEGLKGRTHILCLIENLEYMRRGGRIGKVQEVANSALGLRPIVTLKDGKVALVERIRTRRAGLRRLVELVAEMGPLERLAVLHAGDAPAAEQVANDLAPLFPREEMLLLPATQVVTTHVGIDALGVCFVVGRGGE